jgi:uncharacterized protein YjbI with pentapeptide repeats
MPTRVQLMTEAQLINLRLREFDSVQERSPLQTRGATRQLVFFHKSFRDFYAAKALARDPAAVNFPLDDAAVIRFAAELVDVRSATALVRSHADAYAAGAQPPNAEAVDFGRRALLGMLAARGANVSNAVRLTAVNCATVLNAAGVSFFGLDLRGLQLCADAAQGGPGFAADLGGAMLSGVNLTGANLAGCRMQQASRPLPPRFAAA